jgi:hypothetical protein
MEHACLDLELSAIGAPPVSRAAPTLPPLPRPEPLQPPSTSRRPIEEAVAQVFGVHAPELHGLTRGRAQVALARQVAMYLAHIALGQTLSETGRLFSRDRTTVAHACCVVEDLRDNPVFDRIMQLLECVVRALVAPRAYAMPACN